MQLPGPAELYCVKVTTAQALPLLSAVNNVLNTDLICIIQQVK